NAYQYSYSCGWSGTCWQWVYPEATATANCPNGSLVSGGAYLPNGAILTVLDERVVSNAYQVRVQNHRTYGQYFYSQAACISIN
ncbi:MAG: hypothetical protein OEY72_09330, partial [Gammaproteobacteria bacterium]|nr:hypothetical protein [Gammaproteobacteria bacterium]